MNDLSYRSVILFYNKLRFSALPFVFIGLGISQLVWGWMGDTILLRYIYPIVCIGIGLGIGYLVLVFLWLPIRETPVTEATLTDTLRRLATGTYGAFEATPELRRELLTLKDEGAISYKRRTGELPDSGDELGDHVTVAPRVLAIFAAKAKAEAAKTA